MTDVNSPLDAADERASVPKLMTTSEVAVILRVSEKTILRRIKNGKLPAFREGGRWLIDAAHVRALLVAGMSRVKNIATDAA